MQEHNTYWARRLLAVDPRIKDMRSSGRSRSYVANTALQVIYGKTECGKSIPMLALSSFTLMSEILCVVT